MNWKFFKYLTNKYVLVTLFFLVQLTVFESIDVFSLMQLKKKESLLYQEVHEIESNIEKMRLQTKALSDPEMREKFSRENHYFKRPHEKIFIISNE